MSPRWSLLLRDPRPRRSPSPSLALLIAAGASACFNANPAYTGDTQSGSEASSTTAELSSSTQPGTAGESTTDAGTGTGTDTASGADASTPPPPVCGDGELDPGEQCDDGNDALDDGCVACAVPKTCAELLALAPAAATGVYKIDPGGSGVPWQVTCDMDIDGGGWTGFSVQDTCNGHLESLVVPLQAAVIDGVDPECRPYSEYPDGGGAFAYYWDITFPPGFSAFFLRGYEVKSIGEPELKYPQTTWQQAYDFPNGALSLGSAYDQGPLANWVTDNGMPESFADGQVLPYPKQDHVFMLLGESSDLLRIGWGETGIYAEGLFPWWSGQIFLR